MQRYQEAERGERPNQGLYVPIVAFYSIQGGVGKTTLARKFAELVTVAPGREGRKPNVLLIDLDVDSQGLTFRLASRWGLNCRTVHQVLADQDIDVAEAIDVTASVSLSSGNPSNRGRLYLVPAAPPEAKGLFDTLATTPKDELLKLLRNLIEVLVVQYDISCVVIDCAPGANPYAAAAATLADIPFLIGRNEQPTYEQIHVLPARFREWYEHFQPARQRVIINAVAVKDLYESRAQKYAVFDYIPLTSDVILETEGLPRTGTLRTLLFEKYIVDIIKRVFVGMDYLIPEAPEVVGQEWIEVLTKLNHSEEAPKVRRLGLFSHLRWIGAALVIFGIALIGVHQVFDNLPPTLINIGVMSTIVGILFVAVGWYAGRERQRILTVAHELVLGGPEEIFLRLKLGATQRKWLEEMKKLAVTIPADVVQ